MQEARAVYYLGIQNYASNTYNLLNWIIIALYMASFICRIIATQWLHETETHTHAVARSLQILKARNFSAFSQYVIIQKQPMNFSAHSRQPKIFYFLEPCIFNELSIKFS